MTVCFIVVVIGFFVVWLLASGRSNKDDEVLVNANMDIRIHEVNVDGLTAKQFEVQGAFPFESYGETVGLVVSVFDCTDDDLHPVLSTIESFQERYTIAYESRVELGYISPGTRIHPWAPIGVFIPEIMLAPHGGYRQFLVVVRLVDVHTNVLIVNGVVIEGEHGVYWSGTSGFSCSLGDHGYVGMLEKRRELQSAAVRLAAAVAIADGTLDSEEIHVVQQKIEKWIERAELSYDGLSEAQREKSYRTIAEHALNEAKNDQIDTGALLKRLRHEGDQKLWYEVMELCFDVMAADGIADLDELRLLREISNASGINAGELEKLRDRKIVDLDTTNKVKAPLEELLGIEADWDHAKIKHHLRKEYKKWNSRLNTVSEGKARQNAQSMLNMIGDAYKKYNSSKQS